MRISILLTIFLISLASANGLSIVGENTFNIEKTEGVATEFQVTIQNQDTFTFNNITTQGQGIATMSKIPKLDLGQLVNMTIKLNKDEDFDGKLKIIGEYEAKLGASNQTEIIEINYDTGIDKCDLTLVKGDSVIWKNDGLDEIKLKNVNGDYFATIQDGGNYSKTFSEPTTLEYVAVWLIPFTEICKIEVLNDEGFIHSSEYDAEINLKLNISYSPTTIETTFLSTSYSLDYNQIKENEYFLIKNTGNKTARIKLSSDWIGFEENNFNLASGDSKNVEYSINPMIMQTNQTNKTYMKKIKIEGNFNTREENISVYIKHANLDEIIGGDGLNEEWFENVVKLGCLAYPDSEECKRDITYYNGSGGSTLELNQESFLMFLKKYGEDLLVQNVERKADAEFQANMTKIMAGYEDKLSKLENSTTKSNEVSKASSDISVFLITLLSSSIILVIFIFLIIKYKKKEKLQKDLGISVEEIYG